MLIYLYMKVSIDYDCVNPLVLTERVQIRLLERNPIDLYPREPIAVAGIGILLLILFFYW